MKEDLAFVASMAKGTLKIGIWFGMAFILARAIQEYTDLLAWPAAFVIAGVLSPKN